MSDRKCTLKLPPHSLHCSKSGASSFSFSFKTSVAPTLRSSPLLHIQFFQSWIFRSPLFQVFHRVHAHFVPACNSHANNTANSVASTATTTLKNVVVETPHPSPLVLSSHRSPAWGQTFVLKIGDSIGNGAGFGRQAEDCGSDMLEVCGIKFWV